MTVYREFLSLADLDRVWVMPGDVVATYSMNEETIAIKENRVHRYAPTRHERVIYRRAPFEDVAGTVLVDETGRVVALRAPQPSGTHPWLWFRSSESGAINSPYKDMLGAFQLGGWSVLFQPSN